MEAYGPNKRTRSKVLGSRESVGGRYEPSYLGHRCWSKGTQIRGPWTSRVLIKKKRAVFEGIRQPQRKKKKTIKEGKKLSEVDKDALVKITARLGTSSRKE